MQRKTKYVRQKNLGGMMFWELSQDTAGIELLRTLQNGLIR
jgi:GH18 family chitinase